jgi:hypothetical protein
MARARLLAYLLVLAAAGCCGSPALATPCSAPPRSDGVSIVSPALECRSRLCLVTRRDGVPTGVCTDECSSDQDCAGMDGLYCRNGYTCAPVGRFPHSVCVCVE